jgi:hypothetical protein
MLYKFLSLKVKIITKKYYMKRKREKKAITKGKKENHHKREMGKENHHNPSQPITTHHNPSQSITIHHNPPPLLLSAARRFNSSSLDLSPANMSTRF